VIERSGAPTARTTPSTTSRSSGAISSSCERGGEHLLARGLGGAQHGAPTVYVTFEPRSSGVRPELVSAVTTRTSSGERPNAARRSTAKPVLTPLMSAADVTTVIVPSAFTRQTAAAARAPGPVPGAIRSLVSGSESRVAHSGCSRIRSSTSTAPMTGTGCR
jgi:hypothetical protein